MEGWVSRFDMVTTASQLGGLVVSMGVYVASLPLALRARRGLIRHMPPQWRGQVPLNDAQTVRDTLAQWRTPTPAGWLLTVLVPFAVVLATRVSLSLEVVYTVAVALMFTVTGAHDDSEELNRSAASLGLRPRRRPLTIPWLAVQLMCALGWVGVAASLGGLMALAVT